MASPPFAPHQPPIRPNSTSWWKRWWRRLPPSRQDRFATLGPLLAVLLFLSAIVVAIAYLRFEEIDREREAVTRDVEYAQQRCVFTLVKQVAPQLLLGTARLATENALPQWHVFCVLEYVDAAAAQACSCLGFQGVVVEQPAALRQVRGDIAGKRVVATML